MPQNPLVRVSIESPNQPEVIALIADLDAYQDTLYPAEARYVLGLASLVKRNVLFAVARSVDGAAIGCGAVVLNDRYGEVKRMYVQPEARGQGAAQQIIDTLESTACANGCTTFMLETGPYQVEALAFYAKQGYEQCAEFGDYPKHPLSVFMRKHFVFETTSPLERALHNVASGSKSRKKSLSDRNVRAGHVRIAKGFLTMDLNRAVAVQRSSRLKPTTRSSRYPQPRAVPISVS
jgi:putative acetyltransferase